MRRQILLIQIKNTSYRLYFWNSNNLSCDSVKSFSQRRIGIERYESPYEQNQFFGRKSYKSLIFYCDNLHFQITKTT